MYWMNPFHGFEFDEQDTANHEIGSKCRADFISSV